MDIQLPELSGLEHTKAIKADDDLKDVPILAVTAFAMKGDREVFLNAGCDGYISKPFIIPDLLKVIKKLIK